MCISRASVFLVTVHEPICTDDGDLEAALYGSFLPVPPVNSFPTVDPALNDRGSLPGAIIARKERIVINRGCEKIKIKVTNNGDRPIQVNIQTLRTTAINSQA
jgi:urease